MPMSVKNFDVVGVCDRVVRFAQEMILSTSSSYSEFTKHDRIRLESYIEAIDGYMVAFSKPEDPLDAPATSPHDYPLMDFPPEEKINKIDNLCVKDLVRRLRAIHVELAKSQSRKRVSGFLPFEHGRIKPLLENMQGVIDFGATTLDMPEDTGDTDVG